MAQEDHRNLSEYLVCACHKTKKQKNQCHQNTNTYAQHYCLPSVFSYESTHPLNNKGA